MEPIRRAAAVATEPPLRCEVLVVGAGPAGSACAQRLAQAGRDVLLVDQHRFPRDKVCGDGLIPDAHAALQRMGVLDAVLAQAQQVPHVRCVSPGGRFVDVPGMLAVLPRRVLDDLLCRAAQAAGARFVAPLRFLAPLLDASGRVCGATLGRGAGDSSAPTEVRARWVVLATGATPQALLAAGLCERQAPSAVALRGYVRHAGLAQTLKALHIVWHPRLQGGYGWIFPGPGGVFNIGTGLSRNLAQRGRGGPGGDGNLRQLLQAFAEVHAPARELLQQGELLGPLKGAPLRCSLRGARWSRPGLLVTGEAAGSTYAFTGEGIGKALQTGMDAAQALLDGELAEDAAGDAAIGAQHALQLRALQPRFDVYDRAEQINRWPWLVNLVVWRATRSPRILRRMSGVLDETQSPQLFSLRAMRKLLFE